ncbi:hypothetical protein [Bacillus sp. OTU2372]|uniref:hypothetical protein n=1 Tax=Bacillus sp. OTU2372 TaxID=3043858 RepID=UPI00313B535B
MIIKDYLANEKKQWLRYAIELNESEHKWLQFFDKLKVPERKKGAVVLEAFLVEVTGLVEEWF